MAQYGGFFNSNNLNKRKYQDIDFARMLSLISGGQGYVAGYLQELEVIDSSSAENGIKVKVKPGAAWIGEPAGWWFINDEDEELTLDNSELSESETRVDRIVVELNRNTDELIAELKVKVGPPEEPILNTFSTSENRIHEISLANVLVTGGSNSIIITDERNSELCGKVTIVREDSKDILRTESFVLSTDEINSFVRCSSSSEIVVTVPLHSNVPISIGTDITIAKSSTGDVTITPETGVIIVSVEDKRKIDGQYAAVTLRKVETDAWYLVQFMISYSKLIY
jgi:hypothetical protein